MDKEALLSIVLSELHEVETLIKSFRNQPKISDAYFNLAQKKLNNLLDELDLLRSLTKEDSSITTPKNPHIDKGITSEAIVEEKLDLPTDNTAETSEPTAIKEETPKEIKKEISKPTVEIKKMPEPATKKEEKTHESTEIIKPSDNPEISKPKEIQPTKETSSSETSSERTTLGDKLGKDKKSVNESMVLGNEEKSNRIMGKKVHDLTKGLGINDRFLYQRELFDGNAELLNQTLIQLNDMPNFDSAISFLMANFDWPKNSHAEQSFFDYLRRKFS